MPPVPTIDNVLAQLQARGIALPNARVRLDWYGDSAPLSDRLLALIRSGRKRAGTGLLWLHEAEGEPYGKAGDVEIVLTHANKPSVVTRLTRVDVVPYREVTAEYAAIEGEGDGSLAFWRAAHWDYFGRVCRAIGKTPSDDMLVICSTFEVLRLL